MEQEQEGRLGRRGRVGLGPLLLLVPLLALVLAFRTLWAGAERETTPFGESVAHSDAEEPPASPEWLVAEGATLAPLHADPHRQAFDAERLRTRYGLPPGEPWRLAGSGLGASPRVDDDAGTALVPFVELAREPSGPDPTYATLVGDALTCLWGRPPGAGARLVRGERVTPLAPFVAGTAPASPPLAAASAESRDPRDAEIARLEEALLAEQDRRRGRELAWVEYNRALARLGLDGRVPPFPVDEDVLRTAGPELDASADDDPAAARALALAERTAEIRRSLDALLLLEEVRGIDLLEHGTLGRGSIGPVVFRLLDDRGRLAGHIAAERLRLEGSRAGRTLTLVLEDGYEAHGGARTPFADGARRLVLPHVDPIPWMETVPELFPPGAEDAPVDDGLWDLTRVRRALNVLLAEETAGGWWRLKSYSGVLGHVLVDVHLEELDADGRIARRMFADRMSIERASQGIKLSLVDGVTVRGEAKIGFLDGQHELWFPRAPVSHWENARLPGLGAPDRAPSERDEAAGGD